MKTLRRYYLGEREVGESIIDNKRENDYGYWEEQVYHHCSTALSRYLKFKKERKTLPLFGDVWDVKSQFVLTAEWDLSRPGAIYQTLPLRGSSQNTPSL